MQLLYLKTTQSYKSHIYAGTREVKSLKVKCEQDDCPWQGELRSLMEHLDGCEYTFVPCPNECDVEYLAKKDLELHLKSECLRREYECPYCEEEGEYEEMTTTHLEECDEFEIECPNLGCEGMIPRWKLHTHRSTCDSQPVSCKYTKVGCEERPLRKDLKKHEEDSQLHLQMTMDRVLELNAKVAKLDLQLCAKDKQITDLEKKILNESRFVFKVRRLQNIKEVQSPSFYTSRAGYKMRMRVQTKGRGGSQHTHLSVFAYLMEGDNDDYLTWPFTGTVTVELLNQLEDKNHHKRTVIFPADSDAGKRVVHGKRGGGWGKSQFISLADLDYQPSKNCQYLQHDILIFQVSVYVRDHKPWLE